MRLDARKPSLMSCTALSPNVLRLRMAVPVLLMAVIVALSQGTGALRAFDAGAVGQPSEALTLPQESEEAQVDGDSELPWLFAVFIVTWAAFFAYVFIMSRRQREMRQEVDALKKVLAEREEKGQEKRSG